MLHFFSIKAVKTKRNRLTLDEKLEIIKLSEQGISNVQIGRQRKMHESSVRKIIKDKTEIKLQISRTAQYGAKQKTKTRKRPMLEMERLLCVWIENCNNRNTPISLAEVFFKAQSLFKFAKTKFDDLTEAEINQPFVASNGWWDRYSKRMNLASENLLGEAASADIKAAEEFPEKLKKIIDGKILCKNNRKKEL